MLAKRRSTKEHVGFGKEGKEGEPLDALEGVQKYFEMGGPVCRPEI